MDWFDFSQRLPLTDPTAIFLLVLLIILFAPIVLNKLHIPHIIGMILAGVIVGEHGFNILVRDSSFDLFGKVESGKGYGIGNIGLCHTHKYRAGNEHGFVEVRFVDLDTAGQYVCVAYVGFLSYRYTLWYIPAT